MSITYKSVAGDTLDIISKKITGTADLAPLIKGVNPGVPDMLEVGTDITVPVPLTPPSPTRASNPNEVAVLIDGVRFRFWSDIRIRFYIDAVSVIEVNAPFEESQQEQRDAFRPFSYKPLSVTLGGQALFTGTAIDVQPRLQEDSSLVRLSAYSVPGVLQDCTAPVEFFNLEFSDAKIKHIASTLCAPFGISVEFDADEGAVFERVAATPGTRVLPFLARLAAQRNLVISATPEGALLFQRSVLTGAPVAVLQQGLSPLVTVTPMFQPQEYYSDVTGIEPVIAGLKGASYTVRNPALRGVVRPFTFEVADTQEGDLKTAVETRAARMFGAMASYKIKLSTWRDESGEVWRTNTLIKLKAPSAMIYKDYTFLIASVTLDKTSSSETATLEVVIPSAYAGQLPEVLPWDD